MKKQPVAKRIGRPPLSPEDRRSAKLSMRTYPDVAAKAQRLGTAKLETLIRKAKEPEPSDE